MCGRAAILAPRLALEPPTSFLAAHTSERASDKGKERERAAANRTAEAAQLVALLPVLQRPPGSLEQDSSHVWSVPSVCARPRRPPVVSPRVLLFFVLLCKIHPAKDGAHTLCAARRKMPWRMSKTRKMRQRLRLKAVDHVVDTLRASGIQSHSLVRSLCPTWCKPRRLTIGRCLHYAHITYRADRRARPAVRSRHAAQRQVHDLFADRRRLPQGHAQGPAFHQAHLADQPQGILNPLGLCDLLGPPMPARSDRTSWVQPPASHASTHARTHPLTLL